MKGSKKNLSENIIKQFEAMPISMDTIAQIITKLNDEFNGECSFHLVRRDPRVQLPSMYSYFIANQILDNESCKIRIEFKHNGKIFVTELIHSSMKA